MSLRIIRAEYFLVEIPLRVRVEHALASRTQSVSGFVVLTDDDRHLGIGEFVCRDYVTGEKPEDCLEYLDQLVRGLINHPIDDPPTFVQSLWDASHEAVGRQGALCAFELALLDLWGKRQGQPVVELIRPGMLQTDRVARYSAVYPFASGAKLAALNVFYRTVIRAEQIKVKGIGRAADDARYVGRIRRAFPYPIDLRLDLNGSLAPDQAEEYFHRLSGSPADVRWFEQPFPKDAWDASETFQRQFAGELVLCADESVCSMEDVKRAAAHGAFRAVNIRIAKNGGLLHSLAIYTEALASGLETQLGCLVGESSVLAYAGLHLAALADTLRYREGCFGKYLIKWDSIQPSLTFSRGGQVSFRQLPKAGLVPNFDIRRVRRRAIRSGILGARV